MKFIKKPIQIEAHQWFKNGDHPLDDTFTVKPSREKPFKSEGKIVRRFRHPGIKGDSFCKKCTKKMIDHGWIDTLEGGHIVCPGDWIITGVEGEMYLCKPEIFNKTYERVLHPCDITRPEA